jgi:Dyp-type peroxidase family
MIGFLDGTSNLRPTRSADDAKLVLIDPDAVSRYPRHPSSDQGDGPRYPDDLAPVPEHEPEWTRNGTYLVVRVSVFDIAGWDGRSRHDQEQAVGRFKVSGASLDRSDTSDDLEKEPVFATAPADLAVPPTAHIRKAYPYLDVRSLYRHGYSIVRAVDGGLQRGLAFIAFARTISTQFEFLVRGQMRNEDFPTRGAGVDRLLPMLSDRVICGGYYFVPAVTDSIDRPWEWVLPDTVR